MMDGERNGHTALLDVVSPAGPWPQEEDAPSVARFSEVGQALLVTVPLRDGMLELRVPKASLARPRKARHHIPGCNPDATPC
jgi:hypothetical protein